MKHKLTRRSFIEKSALATAGAAMSIPAISKANDLTNDFLIAPRDDLSIHVFSKHLQFLDYKATAEAAAEIGFDGVDWSVRPKGHVLPENVKRDLPLAVAELKKVGFEPKMMTSGVTRAEDKYTMDVLETAAKLGIEYYRLGYYKYDNDASIPESIARIRKDVTGLSILNKSLKITGAYQNHAGMHVGAAIWEIWEMLQGVRNDYMGCQYDIRHASVEGSQSWPIGLKLIKPQIKSIVLKDYKWQQSNGKWNLINTPIGEGMVDFPAYFKLLKQYNINVPVSMHYEYDMGGAEHGKKDISISSKEVFRIMKKDLEKVREYWKNA
jgi:L-ribulose-5-phosphate 3-epimerase